MKWSTKTYAKFRRFLRNVKEHITENGRSILMAIAIVNLITFFAFKNIVPNFATIDRIIDKFIFIMVILFLVDDEIKLHCNSTEVDIKIAKSEMRLIEMHFKGLIDIIETLQKLEEIRDKKFQMIIDKTNKQKIGEE